MEVKEIFALRKTGNIEEAYDLISEKYKTYHGHYTTLCMFWCTSDMIQLRLEEGKHDEADKIYTFLEHLCQTINPSDEIIDNQMLKLRNILSQNKTNNEIAE